MWNEVWSGMEEVWSMYVGVETKKYEVSGPSFSEKKEKNEVCRSGMNEVWSMYVGVEWKKFEVCMWEWNKEVWSKWEWNERSMK